ncbi:MAG: EamA family transporter [Candidatus Micrarchaeia archaeon]
MNIFIIIFITFIAAFIAASAQIIFKRALSTEVKSLKQLVLLLKNRNLLFGIFVYFIGLAVYLYALKSTPLSIAYPIFGSVFIFVILLSKTFLHEKIGIYKIIGVLLVVIGIFLVAANY